MPNVNIKIYWVNIFSNLVLQLNILWTIDVILLCLLLADEGDDALPHGVWHVASWECCIDTSSKSRTIQSYRVKYNSAGKPSLLGVLFEPKEQGSQSARVSSWSRLSNLLSSNTSVIEDRKFLEAVLPVAFLLNRPTERSVDRQHVLLRGYYQAILFFMVWIIELLL